MSCLVEKQAQTRPNAVALMSKCGTETMTYAELDAKAHRLAVELQQRGAQPNTNVGILMGEKTFEMYVAVLGVLKAGAAYVPMDAALFPPERIKFIAEDTDMKVLVTVREHVGLVEGGFDKVLVEEVVMNVSYDEVRLERLVKPAECVYMIYTSGTSGTPKGVACHHIEPIDMKCLIAGLVDLGEEGSVTEYVSPATDEEEEMVAQQGEVDDQRASVQKYVELLGDTPPRVDLDFASPASYRDSSIILDNTTRTALEKNCQINPDRFRVVGGARLAGDVYISGAKNSVLKLMAVSLLAPGSSTIYNVPDITDVSMMAELLETLGCKISRDFESKSITIDVPESPGHRAEYEAVRKLRASINVVGPLVARLGKAEVALPGGDTIGSRGLDFHIKGLVALGAEAHNEHGYIIASAAKGLTGTQIELEFPSVGATENIMSAAVLASGVTTLENAAREPEIVDIGNFLIAMGADIQGLGTSTIMITGVKSLKGATHTAISDRIVAGTWAFAATMTLGDVSIHGARPEHLELPLEKLVSAGAVITSTADGIRVKMDRRPTAIDVATLPYPGFPTDLQPFAIALNAIAEGDSVVTENVFEGRFMFVNELLRLGAKIRVDGHHASITGIKELSSAHVIASASNRSAKLHVKTSREEQSYTSAVRFVDTAGLLNERRK